ncbi:hypothetical protein HA402_003171 [Bradysia odoriphaga]|nr:hypothetical protein HA402_003171 [Bradysia odoriphaga]
MSVEKKNNAVALKLRNIGNQLFTKNDFFEALLKYNHSLCFAEQGTEAVGLAYANRSAVYIEMQQFHLCLEDIQLARQFNYPADKLEKLQRREEECHAAIENWKPNPYDNPFNFFKLSYASNNKYPGIVDCLTLSNNKKFGNHLVTTKTLKTGDIICIEEPVFTAANVDARLYRCSYCFKDSSMKLFPCTGCTKAMFCSEKCQRTAMNEFHQFECNVHGNPTMKIDFHLRLLMKCLNVFDYNVPEFQKFVEKNRKPVTVFDFDFSDPEEAMSLKNAILVMLSIQNNAPYCKILVSIMGSEIRDFVSCHAKLKQLWENHGKFLNEMLAKLIFPVTLLTHMSAFFSKEINLPTETRLGRLQKERKPKPAREKMFEQNSGQGLYPAFCLLNGSCDPNVFVVSASNKLVWIVAKPIPAGSQLFCKYDQPFYNSGPASRRQGLFKQSYGYTCCCEACLYDWPRLSALEAVDPSFKYNDNQTLSNHEEAVENIRKNIEYIEKNYKHNRPTKEVYTSIDYNMYEFSSLAKPAWY